MAKTRIGIKGFSAIFVWLSQKYLTAFFVLLVCNCTAQNNRVPRKGEFYLSWGYNKDWYTNSNVKINQPGLGNNYQFVKVKGHDHPGWDEGLFREALTIPQYNYRIGYLLNNKRNLGIEINFDHTKFIISDGQSANIRGVYKSRNIDSIVKFSKDNGFYYYLNNGANFLLFNITKRKLWYKTKNIKVDLFGKAGIGPVIPHVENSFFGNENVSGFQLGGWNTGLEGALRSTFFNHIYLEFAAKLDYARYANLNIYNGRAKQVLRTAELILNLGYTFKEGGYIKHRKN